MSQLPKKVSMKTDKQTKYKLCIWFLQKIKYIDPQNIFSLHSSYWNLSTIKIGGSTLSWWGGLGTPVTLRAIPVVV
jgi:hypothetical protein